MCARGHTNSDDGSLEARLVEAKSKIHGEVRPSLQLDYWWENLRPEIL